MSGVKTGTTGAWKLWVLVEHQLERKRILEGALAIAICDERPEAEDVKALAKDLESALRATAVPTHGKQSIPKRFRSWVNGLTGGKIREPPEMRIFGPTFGEHLAAWLRQSASSPEFEQRLATVGCGEGTRIDTLVDRFPEAFEEELFDERKQTDFREQLINELLLKDLVRDERALRLRRLRARRSAARAGAAVVAPAGTAYAAADALGASDPTAALLGLGAAALGAVIGGIVVKRESVHGAEERTAAQAVLSWVSQFLGRISGESIDPAAPALETALRRLLRQEVDGELRLPSDLNGAAEEAVELSRRVEQVEGGGVLARELDALASSLLAANSTKGMERRVLADVFAVVTACDLTPR